MVSEKHTFEYESKAKEAAEKKIIILVAQGVVHPDGLGGSIMFFRDFNHYMVKGHGGLVEFNHVFEFEKQGEPPPCENPAQELHVALVNFIKHGGGP